MQKYNGLIGTVLKGRYILMSVIGEGGMAVVYSAFDKLTGNTVAVKMLREDSEEVRSIPAFKKQFANEANALASLSHPGIVKFYDSSLEKSPLYFVMEYVEGITLKDYISRKKRLTQNETADFSIQILSALSHIHSKGIVHCDIKPHNVILMKNGRVKLTDFGIARVPGVILDLPPDRAVGTVYYVSPEQAEGKVLDHRSDIYSLGIMMYQMASGRLPFTSNDIDKVARMQASAPPKRPRSINPEITKGLEQIILKAISKKPYMRFTDAAEMSRYLDILRKNPQSVFRLQEKAPQITHSPALYHSHSSYSVAAGVLGALILTLSIAFPSIKSNVSNGTEDGFVRMTVPDLRDKTLSYAAEKLDDDLYDVEIVYDYSSLKTPGRIVSQSPQSGEAVRIDPTKEQCVITLTVSATKTALTMIDVTSLSPEEAEAALIKAGYTVKFENLYSDTVTQGLVCATSPKANEIAVAGSRVTVYISLGADVSFVNLPDLVGKTEAEVSRELESLGLKVGRVTYKSSHLPSGTILTQSVNPETVVPVGTAVDFTVSK